MDPSKFYHQLRYIRTIPEGSSDSELSDIVENCEFSQLLPDIESDCDSYCSPKSTDVLIIPNSDDEILSEFEDDMPLALRLSNLSKKIKKSNVPKNVNKPIKPKWVEENLEVTEDVQFKDSLDLPTTITDLVSPFQFFNFLFPKSIISHITKQSNLYATQVKPIKLPNITEKEIEQFIGILMKMSILNLPSIRHHWGTLGSSSIYNIMTVNRFEEIKRFIHFYDNTTNTSDSYDKLFKVRPLLEQIRNILVTVPKEEYLAVDEQIIPTKFKTSLKQYNPKNHINGDIKYLF